MNMDHDQNSDKRGRGASWLDLLTGQGPPGRQHDLPVLSGSMLPLIPAGSTLVVKAASWPESRSGEIIVFRAEQSLVAHRYLLALPYPSGTLILQKGDANRTAGWIDATRIVGIVTAVRLPDGQVLELDTPAHAAVAKCQARQQLMADLRYRLLYWPRRIKGWLT